MNEESKAAAGKPWYDPWMRLSARLFGFQNPALAQTDFFRFTVGNTLAQALVDIPLGGGMWLAWHRGYGSSQVWVIAFAAVNLAILTATMVWATARTRTLARLLRSHEYTAVIELAESVERARLAPVERLQLASAYEKTDQKKRARALLDSLRDFPSLNPRLQKARESLQRKVRA